MPALCDFPAPVYWFFSENIPPLVYYSHFSAIFLSLALGLFVLLRSRNLEGKTLFFLILPFVFWVLLDSLFWASNRSDVIMFVWSLQILFEPLVFVLGLYLLYLLVMRRDVSFNLKLLFFVLYLPIIFLTPTKYFLSGFDLESCLSTETYWSYYTYVLEAGLLIWISVFGIERYRKSENTEKKKEILFITAGIVLFLLAFASGNIIGSLTGNWNVAQIGLIGTPIFICFIAYTIVKFKTFNIKVFVTQFLAVAVWLSLLFTLFVPDLQSARIIGGLTLAILIPTLLFLVKSVKREVEQREKIEKLAVDLEKANVRLKELDQMKSQFLSFASHQIRSPLTAIKGYSSMVLEGDFGVVPKKLKEVVGVIDTSAQSLIVIVNDFLDVSRIEQGRMKYEFVDFDVNKLVQEVVSELRPNVESKGLTFTYTAEEGKSYASNADIGKIKQVIGNVIDNAIKYTPKGSISVHVEKKDDRISITVSDTGVGIDPEEATKLFSMFSRAKDASKANVSGTGLGLYVAKKMLEAQKGKIWVESEGKGKGSTFHIELQAK